MKKHFLPLPHVASALLTSLLLLTSTPSTAEEIPAELTQELPTLQSWSTDPVLIEAVKQQNAQHLSLDDIKARDESWRNTSGVDAFMDAMMKSPVALHMLELEKSKPYLTELFLMDNQGANIAMTNKTSDYWQGDEDKFTESFKGGQGATHMGDVEFDESTQAYLIQVSIPIMDAGKAIGAMTIGVNLDEMK